MWIQWSWFRNSLMLQWIEQLARIPWDQDTRMNGKEERKKEWKRNIKEKRTRENKKEWEGIVRWEENNCDKGHWRGMRIEENLVSLSYSYMFTFIRTRSLSCPSYEAVETLNSISVLPARWIFKLQHLCASFYTLM